MAGCQIVGNWGWDFGKPSKEHGERFEKGHSREQVGHVNREVVGLSSIPFIFNTKYFYSLQLTAVQLYCTRTRTCIFKYLNSIHSTAGSTGTNVISNIIIQVSVHVLYLCIPVYTRVDGPGHEHMTKGRHDR